MATMGVLLRKLDTAPVVADMRIKAALSLRSPPSIQPTRGASTPVFSTAFATT